MSGRRERAFVCRRFNTLLYAERFDQSVAFYRDGLGLPVRFSNPWFFEFEFNAGASVSVLARARTRMRATPAVVHTLTVEVADLGSVRRALAGRELLPGDIQRHRLGANVFYLHDPDGNCLEFWSPD